MKYPLTEKLEASSFRQETPPYRQETSPQKQETSPHRQETSPHRQETHGRLTLMVMVDDFGLLIPSIRHYSVLVLHITRFLQSDTTHRNNNGHQQSQDSNDYGDVRGGRGTIVVCKIQNKTPLRSPQRLHHNNLYDHLLLVITSSQSSS